MYSFSLVYLPIKAPTLEQNNSKNTNTTKHIAYLQDNTIICVHTMLCIGDAMQ